MMQISLADFALLGNGQQGMPVAPQAKLSEFETSAFQNVFLARMIVDWNFTDESGEKLKIDRRSIELLDAQDVDHIWKRVQKLLPGRPQKDEANFGKPSPTSTSVGAMDR